MKNKESSIDIYSEVALRTGMDRKDVKHFCYHLFYTDIVSASLPSKPEELIEFIVNYLTPEIH